MAPPTNDVVALVNQMMLDGTFTTYINDPILQFGPNTRRYLGPNYLPERLVDANQFTEESVSYRTIVANDGSRYGPAQLKGNNIVGEVDVKLAEQDIAREFNGRDFDAWRRIIKGQGMQAIVQLTQWVDRTLVRAMLDKQERQRWEAIITGVVPLRGDNSYRDSMTYANPSGHRITATYAFTDGTHDPMDMFIASKNFLLTKGYTLQAIIMSSTDATNLSNNAMIKARAGGAIINTSGTIVGVSGIVDRDKLNALFVANGLPVIQTYDLHYNTETANVRFIPVGTVVFFANTDRDETLDIEDVLQVVSGTIGYHAIGTAVGQDTPGRVLNVEAFIRKPPRIEGELFQTSAPVIMEPESFMVVNGV